MTNKILEKNLTKVLRELKELRRDVALFLPTEKISDYKNGTQIKKSLKNAMRDYKQDKLLDKI